MISYSELFQKIHLFIPSCRPFVSPVALKQAFASLNPKRQPDMANSFYRWKASLQKLPILQLNGFNAGTIYTKGINGFRVTLFTGFPYSLYKDNYEVT